jgi:hypothetical protein
VTVTALFQFYGRVTLSKALIAHLLGAFVVAINPSFSLYEKTTAFWTRALPDAKAFFLNDVSGSEKERSRKVIRREVRFDRSGPSDSPRFRNDVEVPSDLSFCWEGDSRRPVWP